MNIKYHLLICGIKFKEYNNFDFFLYYINLLNLLFVYGMTLYNLVTIDKKEKIFCFTQIILIFSDLVILYYANNMSFKKNISRHYDLIFKNNIKYKIDKLLTLNNILCFIISSISFSNVFKINIINNCNFCKYIQFFIFLYFFNIKNILLILFLSMVYNIYTIFNDFINLLKSNIENLNNITIHYIEVRHIYNKIINVNNKIISNILFLYYIPSIYFIKYITSYYNDLFLFCNFVFYVILIFTFQYFIEKIDDLIIYLKSNNNKLIVLKNFLIRNTNNYTFNKINDISEINTKEVLYKNFVLNLENGNSNDWLIFSTILNQELKTFDLFGIEINNGNLIYKLILLTFVILFGNYIVTF